MTDKYIQRMSGCGSCPRKLSAEWLGFIPTPMPDFVTRSADEGKMHELWITQDLRNRGYIISNEQLEISIETPKYTLLGHIEFTIIWPFDKPDDYLHLEPFKEYLAEIKSGSMYEFQRWMKGRFLEFPNYEGQITAYWEEAKCLFDLAGIVYLYKDRSGGYLDKQVLDYPPGDFNLIRAKLDAVEISVANNVLYEADFDPSSIECKRCNFSSLCIKTEKLDPATEEVLIKATDMCREGRALIKQGEDFYKEGKQILENHCEAVSPDKKYTFTINEMVVPRFEVVRVSYPRDAIEQSFGPEIYTPLQKVSKYWQCTPRDLRKDKEEENGD